MRSIVGMQLRFLVWLQALRPPTLRSAWPRAPLPLRGNHTLFSAPRRQHCAKVMWHWLTRARLEALRGFTDLIDRSPTRDVCLVVWVALFLSPGAYGFAQFWRVALGVVCFLPLVVLGPDPAPSTLNASIVPLAKSRSYLQLSLDTYAAVVVFGGIALSATSLPYSAFVVIDMRMSIAVAWGTAVLVVCTVALSRIWAGCLLVHQAVLGTLAGAGTLGLAHVLRHHFFTHRFWRVDTKRGATLHTSLAAVLVIVALLTFALRSEGQESAFGSVPRSEYLRVLQNIMSVDGSTVGDAVRQQGRGRGARAQRGGGGGRGSRSGGRRADHLTMEQELEERRAERRRERERRRFDSFGNLTVKMKRYADDARAERLSARTKEDARRLREMSQQRRAR